MGKAKSRKDKSLIPPETEETTQPNKKRNGCLLRGICVITLFLACYFVALCLFIDAYGHWDRARPAQAIIIFGARVNDRHVPGDSLRARTQQAVKLYRQGIAKKIICTGGLGQNTPTEAEAAANLACDLGVPAGNLLLEVESTSTLENATNAAKICRAYRWNRVVAVSDPYHLWRVKRDLARVGIHAYTSPARSCLRNRHLYLRVKWTAREGLAIMRDQALSGSIWAWHSLCHLLRRP